jgi:G-protein alpha subunit
MYDDEATNKMYESLKMFRELCNTKWFYDTPIMLFFTKKDLFAETIKQVPLTVCFPDYKGNPTNHNFASLSFYSFCSCFFFCSTSLFTFALHFLLFSFHLLIFCFFGFDFSFFFCFSIFHFFCFSIFL